MKNCWLSGFVFCLIPVALFGAMFDYDSPSVRIEKLLAEKQAKMNKLEKCKGTTKNLKIAGLSTLGITAAGVVVNVAEAVELDKQEKDLKTAKQQHDDALKKNKEIVKAQEAARKAQDNRTIVMENESPVENPNGQGESEVEVTVVEDGAVADNNGAVQEETQQTVGNDAAADAEVPNERTKSISSNEKTKKQKEKCDSLQGNWTGNTCIYAEQLTVQKGQTVDSEITNLLKNKGLEDVQTRPGGLYLALISDSKIPMLISFDLTKITCANGEDVTNQCQKDKGVSNEQTGSVDATTMTEIVKDFRTTLNANKYSVDCNNIAGTMTDLIKEKLNNANVKVECKMDDDTATGKLICKVGDKQLTDTLNRCKEAKKNAGEKSKASMVDIETEIKKLQAEVRSKTDFECGKVFEYVVSKWNEIVKDLESNAGCGENDNKVICTIKKSYEFGYTKCTLSDSEQKQIDKLKSTLKGREIACDDINTDAQEALKAINDDWQVPPCTVTRGTRKVKCSINGIHHPEFEYTKCNQ